jgi:hypothetical protein
MLGKLSMLGAAVVICGILYYNLSSIQKARS